MILKPNDFDQAAPHQPGTRVTHPDFGEGIVVRLDAGGFVTAFFQRVGERRVPAGSLSEALSWEEQVVAGLRPATPDALEKLWLAVEAEKIPLLESAATLTAAKVDLLPHQVVLVHRVANTQPRRFLIADEVGLGKTIETALILRELASRGEMVRALMVVPAGLVDNWRRELNEVFNLDFEVFGSEGDVTDRRSNAFAKHNRLIASVDTLKRPARIRRLKEAPPWDLVVFDEAHHLSVYKTGQKVRKTENYKLAEALRDHCRDLLLLSATPHQGDHFRFWQLVRLLKPELFTDEEDMLANRHRLNAVVARRTKADACNPDGGPLFARRVVHTQAFGLSDKERTFYDALLAYLREGYDLARKQGGKGRALGFVMAVFQKIAASSFLAVRSTLLRRLLMLTIKESIDRDDALDIDGRNALQQEARCLIAFIHQLPDDVIGWAQAERLFADMRLKLLEKASQRESYAMSAESYGDSELAAATGTESAAEIVSVALPEERMRIRQLLADFPMETETKTRVLLGAFRQLWDLNPDEKMVVFTTYLGSVDGLKQAVDTVFPGKGVEVLKGGDHGAKLAAQKRFKRADGPRVLVCTAAGREGINLQFARVLFNYDLPWNPMDLEQRIGRIHRYGQESTAQVYNLVTADTIEGQIYLLLEEKLQHIAATLGKVDVNGQVAEDLRGQILGQLGTQLTYESLYREALEDPSLKRTREELEVAMENAEQARKVVFELFQDLDTFNLGEYREFDDGGAGMRRLVSFAETAAHRAGGSIEWTSDTAGKLSLPGVEAIAYTTDRDGAMANDHLNLLGLEDPRIQHWLKEYAGLRPSERGIAVTAGEEHAGTITVWHVCIHGGGGKVENLVTTIAAGPEGRRIPHLERKAEDIFKQCRSNAPQHAAAAAKGIAAMAVRIAPELLHRDLEYRGVLQDGSAYSTRLLALATFCPCKSR